MSSTEEWLFLGLCLGLFIICVLQGRRLDTQSKRLDLMGRRIDILQEMVTGSPVIATEQKGGAT